MVRPRIGGSITQFRAIDRLGLIPERMTHHDEVLHSTDRHPHRADRARRGRRDRAPVLAACPPRRAAAVRSILAL
jgi:hypothetical protein